MNFMLHLMNHAKFPWSALWSLRLDYETIHLVNCLRPSANLDYLSIVVVDELLGGIKDLQEPLGISMKSIIKLFRSM